MSWVVSDQLLLLLRVCLLALVYLVFLRVVRAVWVELRAEQRVVTSVGAAPATPHDARAPAGRTATSPAPAPAAARLVIVAPAEIAGRVFPLAAETTIGRGRGCGVAIDDTHVSKLHARLFRADDGWMVEDLGSTNGTKLEGQPLTEPRPISPGARLQVGAVELELA